MLKIVKGSIIVFALDRENIDRLMNNKPIVIIGDEVLLPGRQIVIIANETLDDCKEDLRSIGIL